MGEKDLSYEDFQQLDWEPPYATTYPPGAEMIQYSEGFVEGVTHGISEAASELPASLWYSLNGAGQLLWGLLSDPNVPIGIFEKSCQIIEYLRTQDLSHICTEIAPELYYTIQHWDKFEPHAKGTLVGQILGKYGVDAFACFGCAKASALYQEVKKTNTLCNIKSMTSSVAHRNAITAATLRHHQAREKFFKNQKIEWDKQHKHTFGHKNYDPGKSIFEHENAQALLDRAAGSGIPKRGNVGNPGYQEVVNFNEHIGIWKSSDGSLCLPTTKGTIHYSKNGAHIVPFDPRR